MDERHGMDIDEEDQWEPEDVADESPLLTPMPAGPKPKIDSSLATMMCLVDRSGIHEIPVQWCRCPGHLTDERQLFAMGLFPSTFTSIKTAFTFQVLDDFRMDNLECKTAALTFYNKLRRITSNAFPDTIKVFPMLFIFA
jgi:CxC2 like cysteine cluster associated with KDZ transposases